MKLVFKNYKKLSINEHEKLLNIRNSEFVKKGSITKENIILKNHLKWVENLNSDKKYYALFVNETIQGGVNIFDINTKPKWGLFFEKETPPMIAPISAYIFLNEIFENLDIKNLYSEVNIENKSAYNLSLSLGMEVENIIKINNQEFYKMKLSKEKWNENKKTKFIQMILKRIKNIEYVFID